MNRLECHCDPMHGKLGYIGVTIYTASVPEGHDSHMTGRTDS